MANLKGLFLIFSSILRSLLKTKQDAPVHMYYNVRSSVRRSASDCIKQISDEYIVVVNTFLSSILFFCNHFLSSIESNPV
jgi:hypothetical protein